MPGKSILSWLFVFKAHSRFHHVSVMLVAAFFVVAGCAFDVANIRHDPVEINLAASTDLNEFVLDKDVRIHNAPCNYDRTLKAGTRWQPLGKVPQGAVYHSHDQILTIECSNVFEAYIVVNEAYQLVGAYLPVEDSFVALKQAIPLLVTHSPKEN